eukprot:CAMPEP_0177585162 /NCGR_PEP_ID=MMETSP0419_2-20121207/4316_1 /TAXON_ID=582737 /ORGANISM="Tetraselmis sp., Strain GSL018" /LENGTH=183 /DNA_ID=CAMNT_0019074817 /DNA_START=157 /DNA_END=708 /DNA_ORIENTATION=-
MEGEGRPAGPSREESPVLLPSAGSDRSTGHCDPRSRADVASALAKEGRYNQRHHADLEALRSGRPPRGVRGSLTPREDAAGALAALLAHGGQPFAVAAPGSGAKLRWNVLCVCWCNPPARVVTTHLVAGPRGAAEGTRRILILPHWVWDALQSAAALTLVSQREASPKKALLAQALSQVSQRP